MDESKNKNSEISVKTGARIRYFRGIKRMSQEELALNADINPAYIGHSERGLKCPTVATLEKVCNALGITLSQLLDFEDKGISGCSAAQQRLLLAVSALDENEVDVITEAVVSMLKLKKQ